MDKSVLRKILHFPEVRSALGWCEDNSNENDIMPFVAVTEIVNRGFLSRIYDVKDTKHHKKSLVVKLSQKPSRSEIFKITDQYVLRLFNREILFYTQIYPHLAETALAKHIPKPCFAGHLDSTIQCIILTNLQSDGFQCTSNLMGVDVPTLKVTLSTLAKLQVCLTKFKRDNLDLDLSMADEILDQFDITSVQCTEKFLKDVQNCSLFQQDEKFDIEKFETFISRKIARSYERNLQRPSIVKHNDLWENNLLYRVHEGAIDCAIIDWQLMNDGVAPFMDFVHFILSCSAENALQSKETFDQLWQCYWEELQNVPYEFTAQELQESLVESVHFSMRWLVSAWEVLSASFCEKRILNNFYYVYKYILQEVL